MLECRLGGRQRQILRMQGGRQRQIQRIQEGRQRQIQRMQEGRQRQIQRRQEACRGRYREGRRQAEADTEHAG